MGLYCSSSNKVTWSLHHDYFDYHVQIPYCILVILRQHLHMWSWYYSYRYCKLLYRGSNLLLPSSTSLPVLSRQWHFHAGTPMHHAAMANKKEMMFTLARLGCDWRARAEGIDGATAAFVLCGQHTRTTRQQVCQCSSMPRT